MIDDATGGVASDVLARVDLVAEAKGGRGYPTDRPRLAVVELRRPLLYPVRPRDVGAEIGRRAADGAAQLVGMVCAVELDAPPRGRSYGPLDLDVWLPSSCRVVAFPGAPAGVRGLYGNAFSRRFAPADGPTFVVDAVVEVPPGVVDLTGEMSCHVAVRRSLGGRVHVVSTETEKTIPFAERIGSPRAVRLVVAVDVQAYSARDPGATERAQDRLAKVVDQAIDATRSTAEDRQEGGDSLMVVFPPGIDERAVLDAFYREFTAGLRETNLDLDADAAIRLRVGADRGLTVRAGSGWTGQGPITAARLRDCPPARAVLRDQPDVPFVLTVSDSLYRDVFSERGRTPVPESFRRVAVDMAEKGFTATAWTHAGG